MSALSGQPVEWRITARGPTHIGKYVDGRWQGLVLFLPCEYEYLADMIVRCVNKELESETPGCGHRHLQRVALGRWLCADCAITLALKED